jgi:hypothetical protein
LIETNNVRFMNLFQQWNMTNFIQHHQNGKVK